MTIVFVICMILPIAFRAPNFLVNPRYFLFTLDFVRGQKSLSVNEPLGVTMFGIILFVSFSFSSMLSDSVGIL